jgi:hypothetical protein
MSLLLALSEEFGEVGPVPFEFTVQTDNVGTSNNDQFTLPLESVGTYSCTVQWGDGEIDDITVWNQAETTHTYPAPGNYTIRITGTILGWRFNNGGDRLKLLNINCFGPLNLGNSNGYFYGCENMTITCSDQLDMTGTTTLENAFRDCKAFQGWPSIGNLDVSSVTTLRSTFENCFAFNFDISGWNVRNATDKLKTLAGCIVFNQSLNIWDMELTTNLERFFENCIAYNQRFDSWNLSACNNIFGLLNNCQQYNQPVTNLDLTNSLLTNISGMFASCLVFNQPINQLDLSSINNVAATFSNCFLLDQPMNSLDFSSVTTASGFLNNGAISTTNYDAFLISLDSQTLQSGVTIDMGNSEYSPGAAETARSNIISGDSWTIIDGGLIPFEFTVDTTNAGSASDTFIVPTDISGSYNCTVLWGDGNQDSITTYNDSAWTHVYSTGGIYTIKIKGTFTGIYFNNTGDKDKITDLAVFTNLRLGNTGAYFHGCSNLTISATDNLILTGTTDLSNGFAGCSSLIQFPSFSTWDFSSITTLQGFLNGCGSFTQALVNNTTSNVTNFSEMNIGNAITKIPDLDYSSATTLATMFLSCGSLNDSYNFNTSIALVALDNMFLSCGVFNGLITFDNTSNVTTVQNMHNQNFAFNQPINYDTSSVQNFSAFLEECSAFDQDLSGLDFSSATDCTFFLNNAGLSTANYDALLISLDAQTLQSGVTFNAGNSFYSPGGATTARSNVISGDSWTFIDSGQVPFEFRITAVGPGLSFTFPHDPGGTYSGTIDWGDTTVEAFTGAMTHVYASSGDYNIKIVGTIEGMRFNNSGDKDLIKEIISWGNLKPRAYNQVFYGCSNLTVTATDILQLDLMTGGEFMFRGCSSITTIPSINSWDWSGILDMNGMFQEMALFNQALNFNSSSCTAFINWLRDSTSFNSTITLDTTACTDMFALCSGCTSYNQAPDFSTDLGNVWRYVDMYGRCTSLDQDFSVLSFASATDCTAMFRFVPFSTANYDALWNKIGSETLQNGVIFEGGNGKLSLGDPATARYNAETDDSWTVIDSGFEISNLQVWLDAADSSTITDTANDVSQWDDKSGTNNNALQAVALDQPTTNINTINGLNVIFFDGVDHFMSYDQSILENTSLSIFIVEQRLSNPASTAILSGFGTQNQQVDFLYTSNGTSLRVAFGTLGNVSGTVTANTTPRLISYTHDATNGNFLYLDKTLLGSNTGSTPDMPGPATQGQIARRDSATHYHGNIAEIIIYDKELNTSERQSVENYLSTKWGT